MTTIKEEAKTLLDIVMNPEKYCPFCQKKIGVCKHTKVTKQTRAVEWHEHNLQINKAYLEERIVERNRLIEEVRRMDGIILFKEHQIAEATKAGITRFDAHRFCVKRKKQ